jgi:hypothetical protein
LYKKDETIVPADAWKEGVQDIRDKELKRQFNLFLDRNINLTVIFDCCHSGALSRGPNILPGKLRFMPESNWDVRDSSDEPSPQDRPGKSFLMISATQSDKFAAELKFQDDSGIYISHGAFTRALSEAIQQEPGNESALNIFLSARALLKNYGLSQEPVISGSSGRQFETLFGQKKNKIPDYSTVAVSSVIGNRMVLEGGWALGLNRGNELSRIDDTAFKLSVVTVTGINKCIATVLKGSPGEIKPGNLFRVTNWASEDLPLISLYLGNAGFSDQEVARITRIAAELKKSAKIHWLESLRSGNPYLTIFFDKGRCYSKVDTAYPKEIKNVDLASLLALCKKDSSVYFEIPISNDSAQAVQEKLSANHNINFVRDISQANYCLFGKLGLHELPAYGFRKTEVNVEDSLEPMPLVTDAYESGLDKKRSVVDSLNRDAIRLSKIRAWLSVIKTPEGSKNSFPFHIEIYNEDRKERVNAYYRIGDSISFRIVADSDFYQHAAGLAEKFVYVFALDQSGAMFLYFPIASGQNSMNSFPVMNGTQLVNSFPIDVQYRVGPPSGTDNFFLLATDEAIPNPSLIFNQEGVSSNAISRSADDYSNNPFLQLLEVGNYNASRAGRPPTRMPSSWVLKKLAIRCVFW